MSISKDEFELRDATRTQLLESIKNAAVDMEAAGPLRDLAQAYALVVSPDSK